MSIVRAFKSNEDWELHISDLCNRLNNGLYKDQEISERTIRRYFEALKDFKCYITKIDKKRGWYKMESDIDKDIKEAIDDFLIMSSVKKEYKGEKFIFLGQKEYSGSEFFIDLKNAILDKKIIRFDLVDFQTGNLKEDYFVKPCALKESRGRWYLLGLKKNEDTPKSFCLDRIRNLNTTDNGVFEEIKIDWEAIYHHCYAMFTSDSPAEKVVLSFDERDGNYVRSKPIHHSQKEIDSSDGRVWYELEIKVTLDLIMELLSRAWSVKVHEPERLRLELIDYWKEAIERNQ
jgi:predicted DNA-binding transcriptional regulator YafY